MVTFFTLVVVPAVVLDHGVEHRLVRRQAGDAHALALQVARPADVAGARDHGRERPLHERADPDDVAAAPRARGRGRGCPRPTCRPGPPPAASASRCSPRARGSSGRWRRSRRGPRSAGSRARSCPARWCPRSPRRRSRARHANSSAMGRNLRTAANTRGERSLVTEVTEVQDRGPAAYIAEFIGTLLLVFFVTAVVSLYVTVAEPAEPESVHRLLGGRARARVPAVRPDPDARGHLRRALQPGGDRRPWPRSARSSLIDARDLHRGPVRGRRGGRAAHQGAAAGRGEGRELRRARPSPRGSTERSCRGWSSRGSARSSSCG